MDIGLDEILSTRGCTFEFLGTHVQRQGRISGVSIDSRSIRPRELYFAIRGERHDGHDFVGEVLEKKAAAAVVDRSWWKAHGGSFVNRPVFVVENTLTALQKLANHYRREFSIPVIALTGTNGKTTTKEMVAAVLSQNGNVCKTQGNFNNHIGVPLTIFRLNSSHDFLIVEMGAWLKALKPP